MDDLISRQAVIDAIRTEVQRQISGLGPHALHIVDMCFVEDAINALPVVERPKGKWLLYSQGLGFKHKCSLCDFSVREQWIVFYKFCPNCGAEMESEE